MGRLTHDPYESGPGSTGSGTVAERGLVRPLRRADACDLHDVHQLSVLRRPRHAAERRRDGPRALHADGRRDQARLAGHDHGPGDFHDGPRAPRLHGLRARRSHQALQLHAAVARYTSRHNKEVPVMSHPFRYATLTLLTIATLAAANIATAATGSFRETLGVAPPLELEVTTGSGSITIREGAAYRAEIVGEIRVFEGSFFFGRGGEDAEEIVRALAADPPIELDGNRLRIGHIEDPDYRHNVSISYEITVPADTAVQSHTGSGRQNVSGLTAPVTVGTGSGSIELANIRGDVHASTGSGGGRGAGIGRPFH